MLKKFMTIGFVLMLAFQPVTSVAAASVDEKDTESNEAEEADVNAETEETEGVSEEDAEEEAEEETSETDEEVVEEADKEESEEAEAKADEEESESTEKQSEEADETEASTEEESDEEVDTSEEELETAATADEDIKLQDVIGTASGDITYDIAKGAYVLDLRAGFSSSTSQHDIDEKWVAFALPNGVDVASDLPSGTVRIFLNGKTGIAVKVPNIKGIGMESVNKEILLTGEPDDNDPIVNLSMLNVDTEANQFDEIGEVRGQREIDFSTMQANPSIDLEGSLAGDVEYNTEKKQHFLNVTLEVDNNTESDISELYAGFELPGDVTVLDTEDTPEGYKQFRGDDNETIGALQLPNVAQGESESVTYQIPVLGKTEAKVVANEIQLYSTNTGAVGSYNGNINLDFSAMDQDWDFEVTNEVITDYPGINADQKGFRFNYSAKNLTTEDVDKVSMEFIVPGGITIDKPQYIGGDYIDWDGNTATVDLDNIRGGTERYGYFTAVGSTSLTIDQLKDLQVKVTLYRDGQTEEKVINAAFVEGKYDEDDFEDPPAPNPEPEPEPTPPEEGEGDNGKGEGNEGNNGNNNGNNNEDNNNGEGTTPGNTDDNNDKGNNDNNGDVSVEVEDGDDSVAKGDASVEAGNDDNTLPNTATNMYSLLAAGFVMLALGGVIVAIRRRLVS